MKIVEEGSGDVLPTVELEVALGVDELNRDK